MCPVTRFFSVETNLSFWWDLAKFSQKSVPSHTFLRCGDYLKFLMGLGKFRQKVWPVTRFFAVETNLSFWWDLEIISQKSVPSHTFLRCGDYLKFCMGLRKVATKRCAQLHVFFAVETNLSFWWDLEKFSQKSVPSHMFLRCGDYLNFLMGFREISTKLFAQLHVFSLWRLTWVFDGTWKNFHKKVCPVICFFAVETNLSFWWDLEKLSQKNVPSHTFLRCGDLS